ncbi:hypothetical protein FGE12_08785 [Aggregicoccus sp. 17bor-14]|uniref:hypothetical protein n=1 Tax=Myxococcaceae TaxID=31 RepID=UPI00129CAFE2|nr:MULTISPECIES: hypothetical protein [Myxococcaceae]MBF5042495.1 hypothetical protein [Simulacricoccus sp. 17bor-14]MRI88265.1 hypothetical protein [Aggregicoccus sp. 17bor-14]
MSSLLPPPSPRPRLWLAMEPHERELRLSLAQSFGGPLLRARLPLWPHASTALPQLLESLSDWVGGPLCAVLDADAPDVRRRPEAWQRLLGSCVGPRVDVEWVAVPPGRSGAQRGRRHEADRFLSAVGPQGRARPLLAFAALGRAR